MRTYRKDHVPEPRVSSVRLVLPRFRTDNRALRVSEECACKASSWGSLKRGSFRVGLSK